MTVRLIATSIHISNWKVLLAFFVAGYCWQASGQNPQTETKNSHLFATVIFSRTQSVANPGYYSIAIDSTGNATYQRSTKSSEQTGAPYSIEFHASAAIRDRIFPLVEQLNFLKLPSSDSNYSSGFPGAGRTTRSIKTLAFREGSTDNEITFVTPANPLIRQLTELFQNLATTMEFGRRLTNLYQHKSYRIDVELGQMQFLAQKGKLEGLSAVVPVLQQIAGDPNLDKTARTRAESILNTVSPAASNQ